MKTFDKIANILQEISGKDNIELQHNLQTDLGLDSLQMVTLLLMLEDSFEITLDESDMNPFDLTNVCDIVDLTKKYIGGDNND